MNENLTVLLVVLSEKEVTPLAEKIKDRILELGFRSEGPVDLTKEIASVILERTHIVSQKTNSSY